MGIIIKIHGVNYFLATDIIKEIGVTRQTFWRWRHEGKIPVGHRFRNGRILFISAEVESIRQFANRIDPIEQETSAQIPLFAKNS